MPVGFGRKVDFLEDLGILRITRPLIFPVDSTAASDGIDDDIQAMALVWLESNQHASLSVMFMLTDAGRKAGVAKTSLE